MNTWSGPWCQAPGRRGLEGADGVWIAAHLVGTRDGGIGGWVDDPTQITINNIAFVVETMYSIVYILGNKYARLF